jgi:segregation and condensation protein B
MELKQDDLALNVEALIFASETSISLEDIRQVLQSTFQKDFDGEQILACINTIREKYDEGHAINLVEINEGYQFLTHKNFHSIINQLQIQRSRKKLSQAALETLAIIAYKQPITKLEIEQIRGVNCDYTIQKLLEKELITIAGKSDSVGKPLLYASSSLFMDYFGINNKSELPKLQDVSEDLNQIGDQKE